MCCESGNFSVSTGWHRKLVPVLSGHRTNSDLMQPQVYFLLFMWHILVTSIRASSKLDLQLMLTCLGLNTMLRGSGVRVLVEDIYIYVVEDIYICGRGDIKIVLLSQLVEEQER